MLEGIHIHQPRAVKAWEKRVPDWMNDFDVKVGEVEGCEVQEEEEEGVESPNQGERLSPGQSWCLAQRVGKKLAC